MKIAATNASFALSIMRALLKPNLFALTVFRKDSLSSATGTFPFVNTIAVIDRLFARLRVRQRDVAVHVGIISGYGVER